MRHEIETCGLFESPRDAEVLMNIANAITENHARCEITLDDAAPKIRVIARCNGAALRDLVDMLDRAGFLS